MKVAVLGSGLMGSEIAIDLASVQYIDEIVVVDNNNSRLQLLEKRANERLGPSSKKLLYYSLNIVNDRKVLLDLLRDSDVSVGALPHSVAEYGVRAAMAAEVSYVDLIYSWRMRDDIETLDKDASNKGITIIPACGLAPGLSNIIAKRAVEEVGGEAEDLTIYVGGIPQLPEPPLEYRVVFSAESVLEEYTREALVVRDGRQVSIPALSDVEVISFESLPDMKFEAFITDGLSTLTSMVKAKNMAEKTIRWPGHAEKIKLLYELGLLSDQGVQLDSQTIVVPRKLLEKIFTLKLSMEDGDRDMTLMKVNVRSYTNSCTYELIDRFDVTTRTTSMARTTGYPCSVVVQFLLERKLVETGLLPPEVAIQGSLFSEFLERLRSKGIKVLKV
ncbi:MAG: saccharopine dehydrogenase C-terminal domain-containing protein [Conexivisphaerales archaeon]